MSQKSSFRKSDQWKYSNTVQHDFVADEYNNLLDHAVNEYNEDTQITQQGSYEEVFEATGFGAWHFLLLAQCGWANASDAIEIMCTSFTVDQVQDSLKLSAAEATWLTVVLFLGMMVGGYLWGSLADVWGRRQVVIYSLAINGVFGAVSGFAKAYWLLLLLRFFSGVGAGGSLPVCFSYFSEFQPKDKRGAMISALATFWMAGNIFAAGIAWLILPASSSLSGVSPYGEHWRFFIICCAIPSISSSVFFYFMPESPKFLMLKGDYTKAFSVLKKIHDFNNPRKDFQFIGIVEDDNVSSDNMIRSPSSLRRKRCLVFFTCFLRFLISVGGSVNHQFRVMFASDRRARAKSILMMCVYFSIAFGGYGLSMWLPYLMERAEANSGSPCQAPVNVTTPHNGSDTSMYVDVFIGAAAMLPANIVTILFIDRVGGKLILIVSMFLSGISVLFLYLVREKVQVVIVSAAFNCVSTMTWNALDVITPEMYETSVRAAATGFLTALSRVASIMGTGIFGLFAASNCNVPIITVSIVLIFGGIFSVFIPNTKRTELR